MSGKASGPRPEAGHQASAQAKGAKGAVPSGTRLLDRLLNEARLDERTYQVVMRHAQQEAIAIEDALVETGAMAEADLLKFLSGLYKTRFVTTAKLARASISKQVLRMLPARLAERLFVFPILYRPETHALSVVAADRRDLNIEKQIQMVSEARQVEIYLARPAAIRAAIRKHYHGESYAFSWLENQVANAAGRAAALSGAGNDMGAMGGPAAPNLGSQNLGGGLPTLDVGSSDIGISAPPPPPTGAGPAQVAVPQVAMPQVAMPQVAMPQVAIPEAAGPQAAGPQAAGPQAAAPAVEGLPMPSFAIEAPDLNLASPQSTSTLASPATASPAGTGPPATASVPPKLSRPPLSSRPQPEPEAETMAETTVVEADAHLEALNILVALIEQGREELRGHSAMVVRLTRRLGERMGISPARLHGILVAGYLHDVGKTSSYHLTPLNVAQYDGHRLQAEKSFLTPLRLFESANLSETTIDALTHMYERFDGAGFPDKLAKKEIPLGARMLSAVESYVDITTHSKNPYRKVLDPKQAVEALAEHKGTFFDPNMLDLLRLTVLGDDLRSKLLADRRKALLIDADPEETTVLEMRLIEHGYEVAIARNAKDGLEKVATAEPNIIITEVDLSPFDGFELIRRIREQHRDLPVVFLTRRGDRENVTRGFELGAADYVVKPASPEVVAAKTRQILQAKPAKTTARGVTGSLTEMSLPDVVQILTNGRKSGKLTIDAEGKQGVILFGEGFIYDAHFGDKRAQEAVYAMLLLRDGEFGLDPGEKPTERVIQESTESLLLEGMRRMDEGTR